MKKHKKIAITGGIGSGKSLATETIKNAGYFTLSSDEIVKELYDKPEIRKILKPIFPTAIGDAPDYLLDRKKISAIAFSDKAKHKELTDTVTPLVLKEIELKSETANRDAFVEVPLLFECGYDKFFDQVIVVTRPTEDRINSVMARSNLTKDEVIARINNQVNYDNLDLSPFNVIANDNDVESFKKKVLEKIKELTI